MAVERTEEPGILETDAVLVRTMREEDLEAYVRLGLRVPRNKLND